MHSESTDSVKLVQITTISRTCYRVGTALLAKAPPIPWAADKAAISSGHDRLVLEACRHSPSYPQTRAESTSGGVQLLRISRGQSVH